MSTPDDVTFEALRSYGLSEGEIKTLLALIEIGQKEPKDIASKAEVKQPKVYGYLNSLVEQEMVAKIPIEGKPDRYEALLDNVISAIDKFVQQTNVLMKNAKQHLQELKTKQKPEISDFIRIFQGERSVDNGLREIMFEAKQWVDVYTTEEQTQKFQKLAEELNREKGVNVRITYSSTIIRFLETIASAEHPLNENIHTMIERKILPTIVFVDADFIKVGATSANFVLPGIDGLDPIIFHFRHPMVIKFQLMVFTVLTQAANATTLNKQKATN